MKNGDAVTADGDRISTDPEIDGREFLQEPDISVLFSAEIAQDIIIGEIDLFCDAGLSLGLQMASILCIQKSGASKGRLNPGNLPKVFRNILINPVVSDDQDNLPIRGKMP